MLLSIYDEWNNEAMVAQSAIYREDEVEAIHTDVDGCINHVAIAPTETASDNSGTAVQLNKFSIGHYRYSPLLTNDS